METVVGSPAEIVLPPEEGTVATRQTAARDQLAGAWLLAQRSPNTRDAYARDLRTYFRWCDEFTIDALGARRVHIDAYREWLTTTPYTSNGPYTSTTIARKLTAVSSYYSYVAEEAPHFVPKNPAATAKRPEVTSESTTAGLDLREATALLACAATGDALDNALVRLLLGTGLRVSECCAANTSDLGAERGHRTLTVTRKRGKRQKIPIPASAVSALDTYLGRRTGPLFVVKGERITRAQVFYRIRKIARKAGLEQRITPHSLRHTAATLALDAGAALRDVQILLGHVDPRTTTRYDRARQDLDRSAVHVLDRALNPGSGMRDGYAGDAVDADGRHSSSSSS